MESRRQVVRWRSLWKWVAVAGTSLDVVSQETEIPEKRLARMMRGDVRRNPVRNPANNLPVGFVPDLLPRREEISLIAKILARLVVEKIPRQRIARSLSCCPRTFCFLSALSDDALLGAVADRIDRELVSDMPRANHSVAFLMPPGGWEVRL